MAGEKTGSTSGPSQWVKGSGLGFCCGVGQLQLEFNPWPEKFHLPRVWSLKKKKKKAFKSFKGRSNN